MEMFINGKDILLKPINQGNLFLLKQWYEQVDSYGFATGGKSVKDILPVDENSFILGIFITPENKCIGVISGDFKQAKQPVLWIKTFMIDAVWQRKRYGHFHLIFCVTMLPSSLELNVYTYQYQRRI